MHHVELFYFFKMEVFLYLWNGRDPSKLFEILANWRNGKRAPKGYFYDFLWINYVNFFPGCFLGKLIQIATFLEIFNRISHSIIVLPPPRQSVLSNSRGTASISVIDVFEICYPQHTPSFSESFGSFRTIFKW